MRPCRIAVETRISPSPERDQGQSRTVSTNLLSRKLKRYRAQSLYRRNVRLNPLSARIQMKSSLSRILITSSFCLALSGCVAAAAGVGAEAGYIAAQKDRSAGETIDDQLIVTKIKSRLLADPDISGLDINVDSFKGEVTLQGEVDSVSEANRAVAIAHDISGVKNVISKLRVDD